MPTIVSLIIIIPFTLAGCNSYDKNTLHFWVLIFTSFRYINDEKAWRGYGLRDEYDLTDAVRHPLAGQFKGKFTAIIHYDFNEDDEANYSVLVEANLVVADAADA